MRSRPKNDPRTAEASPLDPTVAAPNGLAASADPLGDFEAPTPQPIPVYPLPHAATSPMPAAAYSQPPPGIAIAAPFDPEPPAAPLISRTRYRRPRGRGNMGWLVISLLLAGGMIAGGIYLVNYLDRQNGSTEQAGAGNTGGNGNGAGSQPITPVSGPYPRRLLFMSITKYMYLNPLTATKDGRDQSTPAARRIAFDWRIPTSPDNNQVFILSDTTNEGIIPVKNVLVGAYERFFETSRDQDRIVIYFGGHAIEKEGKAYLSPVEGEIEGEGWQQTLVPLADFYARLQACKAAEKVVIWDVCRFNSNRGKQRPGSDPMTPVLHKLLTAAPVGVEVVVTCSTGENALEFSSFQPDPTRPREIYGGSVFLESARYVGEKSKLTPPASPTEPLPLEAWAQAAGRRVAEMAALLKNGSKQTVTIQGKPPAETVAYNPAEPPATRFEMPVPPRGTAVAEIRAIEKEFSLPPIRSDLTDTGLADLPYMESVMKEYKADVSLEEIAKDKEKYKLRNVTLDALNAIRETWASNTATGGVGNLKEVEAPITGAIKTKINQELEAYAIGIAKLELLNVELDNVANLRAAETKRWQAHYDYARAAVKARLAYLNEYNKLMGNVRTETLPQLDAKLGQNSYKLASSEKMKSAKEVQKLAEEAQEAFGKLIAEHKGTPWAIQAKRDRSFSLGLVWQPYVSGASDMSPQQ
jgi:hypothetical protein